MNGEGLFTLSWMPAPKNDNFVKAIEIKGNSGHLLGTDVGASREKGEVIPMFDGAKPEAIGSSVWYQWTAPRQRKLSIRRGRRRPSYRYSDERRECGQSEGRNRSRLTQGDDEVFRHGQCGQGLQVEDYHAEQGDFDLNWAPRPVNDDFENAILLTGKQMIVEGTNIGSTDEKGEPALSHPQDAPTDRRDQDEVAPVEALTPRSVWYRWTAVFSDPTRFTVVGDNFKPVLAVYTGSEIDALTPIGFEDDSAGPTTDRVSFNAVAGTSYYLLVDGVEGKTSRFFSQRDFGNRREQVILSSRTRW